MERCVQILVKKYTERHHSNITYKKLVNTFLAFMKVFNFRIKTEVLN